MTAMDRNNTKARPRMVRALMETFGFSPSVAAVVATVLVLIGVAALAWVIAAIPPRTLVISSGPPGSTFERFSQAYEKALATHGVKLRVLKSEGSMQNLRRLESADSKVDIGFVQGGLTNASGPSDLVSLGSIAYQPLWIFYRSKGTMDRLSELAGKSVAVGPVGSGTRALALTLLKTNGVDGVDDGTKLLDLDAEAAATALLQGKLDAVFLMGDSAPVQTLRTLIRSPDVRLFDFAQADAYTRRFAYLNKIVLPEGSFDLGKDLPAHDITLVAPTVELVARQGLHPALSDLLLDVAREVHGRPSLIQRRGEFPAPLEQDFKLSDDAERYYKSGTGFFYRRVHSLLLAGIIDRVLVVIVPFILVIVPALRFFPVAYRWRNQLKIYKCYRPLLSLERDASIPMTAERRQELLTRLDEIEQSVNRLKVPASFAEQFYALRGHVIFVRERLKLAKTG